MHIAITGASSGIGEALAREFHRAGASLTLVARRQEKLEELSRELGGRIHLVVHDLSVPARATTWIADAEAALGPIDVLINNAGIENLGWFDESDVEVGERLLATNLLTPMRLMRAVVPTMTARKGGTIVNVVSVASFCATPGQSWYGASKAGLAMAGDAMRAELRHSGVHLLNVYPGPIATPMADGIYERLGGKKGAVARLPEGKADILAQKVRRAVERRDNVVIYPGIYRMALWFPRLARWSSDRVAMESLIGLLTRLN
jgi:short-subunit dehydrogenase